MLILLSGLGGIFTAGRQVWLQTLPHDQLPSCLPPLDYMLETMPFAETLRQIFHGSADCAEVTWTLLSLSIPEWSLLAFVAFALFALYQLFRRGCSRRAPLRDTAQRPCGLPIKRSYEFFSRGVLMGAPRGHTLGFRSAGTPPRRERVCGATVQQ
ncbi:disulfide bond formation protein B [compost metagenome]